MHAPLQPARVHGNMREELLGQVKLTNFVGLAYESEMFILSRSLVVEVCAPLSDVF